MFVFGFRLFLFFFWTCICNLKPQLHAHGPFVLLLWAVVPRFARFAERFPPTSTAAPRAPAAADKGPRHKRAPWLACDYFGDHTLFGAVLVAWFMDGSAWWFVVGFASRWAHMPTVDGEVASCVMLPQSKPRKLRLRRKPLSQDI